MATKRLNLTRDQLAKFLTEHEQIRQFELLFATVDEIQATGIDTAGIDASNALAGVNKLAGIVAQLAQDGAVDASNALAIAQASARALNAVSELAMVGATLPPPVPKRRNVGAWHDTTTQALVAASTGQPITLNSTSFERGVWRDSATTSRIHVADAGIYNVEFSAQLAKGKPIPDYVHIWARVNGVDMPNSARTLQMKGTDNELIASWNFLLVLAGGDSVELVWTSLALASAMQLAYFAASAFAPAIPSVILTITQEA